MVSAIATSFSWCSVNVNIYIFMYVHTCSHSYILVRLNLHTSDWPVDCIWQPESKNIKLRKLPRILHWRKKKKKDKWEIEKQCHNQPTCHWVVKWSPKVFSTNSLMLPSWPSLRSHIKVSIVHKQEQDRYPLRDTQGCSASHLGSTSGYSSYRIVDYSRKTIPYLLSLPRANWGQMDKFLFQEMPSPIHGYNIRISRTHSISSGSIIPCELAWEAMRNEPRGSVQ